MAGSESTGGSIGIFNPFTGEYMFDVTSHDAEKVDKSTFAQKIQEALEADQNASEAARIRETPAFYEESNIFSPKIQEEGTPTLKFDRDEENRKTAWDVYANLMNATLEDAAVADKQEQAVQAQSARRKQDAKNMQFDDIAEKYGITLAPEDYKDLRSGMMQAVGENGDYANPNARKSLGIDAYYDMIGDKNRENAIDAISTIASRQARDEMEDAIRNAYGTSEQGIPYTRGDINDLFAGAKSKEDIDKYDEMLRSGDEAVSSAKEAHGKKVDDIIKATEALMGESGKSQEKKPDEGKAGNGTAPAASENATAPQSGDNQSEEFYKWLETTDSGKAFWKYWNDLGYDFSRGQRGWSKMRTINDADLWGNVYGYGDLSKYGLDQYAAPEGWNDRLLNTGFDINSENLVDQIMDYMFNTHALRKSDLMAENPDWGRYGSLADQQELIEYLFANGMIPGGGKVRDTYNSTGIDERDVAQLFTLSRLGQEGVDALLDAGYSLQDIIDIANLSLEGAGDVYQLGFMDEEDESNPFHTEENRKNTTAYSPSLLYSVGLNPYAYNDDGSGFDLIDWNALDTYYQLINEAAEKQGKKVGLSTKKE